MIKLLFPKNRWVSTGFAWGRFGGRCGVGSIVMAGVVAVGAAVVLVSGVIFSSGVVRADSGAKGRFGLGLALGSPTGITGQLRQGGDGLRGAQRAWSGTLAYSFDQYLLFSLDRTWHHPGFFESNLKETTTFIRQLSAYVGVGGTVQFSGVTVRGSSLSRREAVWLGARVPVGVEWFPQTPPLGVFLELAPGLGVLPNVFGFLEGAVGIRYFF